MDYWWSKFVGKLLIHDLKGRDKRIGSIEIVSEDTLT